jgi:MFS family permease
MGGVVGLWGIGEYAVDLQDAVFTAHYKVTQPLWEETAVKAAVSSAKNWAYLLQQIGGAVGMFLFSWAAEKYGRRPAFIAGFSAALAMTLLVYWRLETPAEAYWMIPLMGAAQLSVFAGFRYICQNCLAHVCAVRAYPSATILGVLQQQVAVSCRLS